MLFGLDDIIENFIIDITGDEYFSLDLSDLNNELDDVLLRINPVCDNKARSAQKTYLISVLNTLSSAAEELLSDNDMEGFKTLLREISPQLNARTKPPVEAALEKIRSYIYTCVEKYNLNRASEEGKIYSAVSNESITTAILTVLAFVTYRYYRANHRLYAIDYNYEISSNPPNEQSEAKKPIKVKNTIKP